MEKNYHMDQIQIESSEIKDRDHCIRLFSSIVISVVYQYRITFPHTEEHSLPDNEICNTCPIREFIIGQTIVRAWSSSTLQALVHLRR